MSRKAQKFEAALERRGSLKQTLQMAVALLSSRERRQGVLVLAMVVLMALLETAGVASVMPFLAVMGNPDIIHEVAALQYAYEYFGFPSARSFLVASGALSIVVIVGSAAFKALTHYVMHRYTYMRRHAISERLLASYLRQPYEFFLDRNSAVLSKTVLSETDQLITYVFKPAMELVAYGITSLALIAFLIVLDPVIALIVGGVIGGAYFVIYAGVRDITSRYGRDRVLANKARFKTASEALGGIKDVKILGREEAYLQRFRKPSIRYSRLQTSNSVISDIPKHLITAIGYTGIIVLALILMGIHEDIGSVLAVLGVYAFAAYRLMPAAQHVFASVAKLRFGFAVVELINADFAARQPEVMNTSGLGQYSEIKDAIRFEHVDFRYPNSDALALTGIDIEIPARQTVGLIGKTGAGKTTVVDLLLGLLTPSGGVVTVDGAPLTPENIHEWRQTVGYVPQQIYLADTSISENIAFGVAPSEIDHSRVEGAAQAAQLHGFVVDELPHGYKTVVGERGVRLSGGQRQRIGIARALYRNPEVIVFDEATSALDNLTESAVLASIEAMSGSKTIVMIAHRLTTLESCERVYLLEHGTVKAAGSYREVAPLLGGYRR